ncbi:hypothetical protein ACHAQD_002485 [Fusarium lateritium]
MSRRAGIKYSESSELKDYEYSRSNDGQRGYNYSDNEGQRLKDLAQVARQREVTMAPPRPAPSPPPYRVREFYYSDEGSGEGDEVIEANGRTYVFDGNEIRPDRNVGGYDQPGHGTALKLRRQNPRSLSDVCNKDTISKDNTVGNQAQMDELFAIVGKKMFGMHCHELRMQPSLHTEPIYRCEYCSKIFDTRQEESGHRTYLWPSDPSRERCKTWDEYFERKNGNIQRRQRQRLTQDEYGDEADIDLRHIDPPPIPKEYANKADAALTYIQASRARLAKDKYVKTDRELESDNDSSRSEFSDESDEFGAYKFQMPGTVMSRERKTLGER